MRMPVAWLSLLHALVASNGKRHSARILFGSCNKPEHETPLWLHILARKPDAWIWGGDIVYADKLTSFKLLPRPQVIFEGASVPRLKELYALQHQVDGYAQLVNSSTVILGTWDDHDFGINDGDRLYPLRRQSQREFLNFLGEAEQSPRRQQDGVYASHRFDYDSGSVLVVLLDMRFHKDPYGTPNGDFLGEEQWRWLQQTLSESTARVHIIVSSLQLLETRQGIGENWGRFPHARERLLRLLTQSNLSAPIVLSGDLHLAEFSVAKCDGGRLVEVTSSGTTHSWGTKPPSSDRKSIAVAMSVGMRLAQRFMPWFYQMRDVQTGAPQRYLGLNFGELEFDWLQEEVAIRIYGKDGHPQLQQLFSLASLDMKGNGGGSGCGPLYMSYGRVLAGFACLFIPALAVLAICARACLRKGKRHTD